MIHLHQPLSGLDYLHDDGELQHHGHDDSGHPDHDESGHHHVHRAVERKRLVLTLALTGSIMVVEVVGGFLTGSLALLSDAGHMLTHFFALLISLIAILIASVPTHPKRSFGLYRVEVLAALFNGATLLLITGLIFYEGINRLLHITPVKGLPMFGIALLGLLVNLISAVILYDVGREDLNVRSAFLHMIGDTASSVGIVAGALIIYFTGWFFIDPLLSILIAFVIFVWSWHLIRDSINILLETAPSHISIDDVIRTIREEAPEVVDVHDVHIWEITSQMYSMTAHVMFRENCSVSECAEIFQRLHRPLRKKFRISHINFSPESA
jgi:cobalt-zinc-cadmium efflux system protein